MLRMLPRLLSKWLRKGDEPCLGELRSAMYDSEPVPEEDCGSFVKRSWQH